MTATSTRWVWDRTAGRLTARDRSILGLWALAHLALLVLAWAAAWTQSATAAHLPLLGFRHWDGDLYVNIAQHGYYGPGSIKNNAAFFPGYPVALTMVHAVIPNWTAAGVALSAVAGGVALVALGRLAGRSRAALYLICAPASVFLFVGYSESLFLAFAVPAWLCARSRRWPLAAVLAFAAAFERVDGLFLIPALAVMALTIERRKALVKALAWLSLSIWAPVDYFAYLHEHTGNWAEFWAATQAGWGIHHVGFVQAFKNSYWGAFKHPYGAEFGFMEQLEIGCLFAMALGAIALLVMRRWAEFVYCGLAVYAVGTSTWYQSVPRTLLVMFPVWALLAQAAGRWPILGRIYLWTSAPIAVTVGLMYLSGRWAG